MFSTIRSFLLGSSAPTLEEPKIGPPEAATSSIHESSSLLELTLNAATSKITEQLLPPSTSIEQLQSSSHQLLPSLNEQLQEDELKKLKKESCNSTGTDSTDDDNELLNDDSWELLDLEKPEDLVDNFNQGESLNSTVRDVCLNMSTLLARHGETIETTNTSVESIAVVRNQKQLKVSFKIPDLITEQQLNINQVNSDIIVTKPATKKNKKKMNKHTSETSSLKVKSVSKVVETQLLKNQPKSVSAASTKKPTLNYAQVLKPKIDASASSQVKLVDAKSDATKPSTLKRNRTVSTNSWSSGDESDMIATCWDEDVEADTQISGTHLRNDDNLKSALKLKPEVNDLDNNTVINESMLSSTFSDFECKYQEMNDFVLKPKKRSNKKQKRISPTSLVSLSKRRSSIETSKKIIDEKERDEATESNNTTKKSNLLKLKPKKKNLSGNYMKSPINFVKTLDVPKTNIQSSVGNKSDRKGKKNNSNFTFAAKTGGSCSPVSSSFGCTDSSDNPDMDESWFVTPPPCFTNADKTKGSQSKLKHANRENELIECPSVYFSSGLKDSCARFDAKEKKKSVNENVTECLDKITLKGLKTEPRICNKPNTSLVGVDSNNVSTRKNTREGNKKKSTISRGNKFIVTNWAFDEQDDIDDFENMFEDERSFEQAPKILLSKKSKKKQNKLVSKQTVQDSSLVSMNNSDDSDSLKDVSPVPVEIDEISMMSMNELITVEEPIDVVNEQLPIKGNIINEVVKFQARRRKTTPGEKKAPVPVQPIEPERRPGWQLKRRRRFLRSSIPMNQGTVRTIKDKHAYAEGSSCCSSVRSTPSIIDRIGSSIVANLTNLTGDFSSSSGLPMQPRAPMQELDKLNCAGKKTNPELELMNRKRLSRSYLNRQNGCAKQGNSKRCEGRSIKMHKTFNGYSVDRKVHTNFPKSQ